MQVLAVKVTLTAFWIIGCWAPTPLLEFFGFPVDMATVFLRLLGVAYVALVCSYVIGWWQIARGGRAPTPIAAGLVSNGVSSLVLFYFGAIGAWTGWGAGAVFIMWASAVILLLITVGLGVFGRAELLSVRDTVPQPACPRECSAGWKELHT